MRGRHGTRPTCLCQHPLHLPPRLLVAVRGIPSGTRGVTDGVSRLALRVATDGASWDKAFFSHVLTFFTDGVRTQIHHAPARLK